MKSTQIGAYMIHLPESNLFYFGSTGRYTKRKGFHLWHLKNGTHSNKRLQEAYTENGVANWTFVAMPTLQMARTLESTMIKLNKTNPYMVNLTGVVASNGNLVSDLVLKEPIMVVSDGERRHSLETKKRMSDRWTDEVRRVHGQKRKGYLHRQESKELMSEKHKGKKLKESTKQLMSIAKKGIPMSSERRIRNAESRGKRVSIDDVVYMSRADAAKALDVSEQTVVNRCRNKKSKWANWVMLV